MKRNHLLFAIITMLISSTAFTQTNQSNEKDNLLFLLRQKEHINQALKTIDYLADKTDTKLNTGKVVIIVCGEAVTTLTTNDAQEWVKRISKHPGVSIMACGLSLSKFNKTKSDLVKGIEYTENGFVKAFELQKQGYLSVEL